MYSVKLFDISEVVKCLKYNISVVVGFKVFPGFHNAKLGKISMPNDNERSLVNHCVNIVKYLEKENEFVFVNSYGEEWGDKGCGYLPYAYLEKYMFEAWIFEL